MKNLTTLLIISFLGSFISVTAQSSPDPGKPDTVAMDSVSAGPGQTFALSLWIQADDSTFRVEKFWVGVGSFCIPIKYDRTAIRIDSVKYIGTIAEWDEKFTNAKIDTGFISFAGLHNIAGKENPVFLSPDKPQEVVRMFGSVLKGAKPGLYSFEMTIDPIQKDPYLGSVDGVNGWRPQFRPGKVLVK